MPTAYGLQIYLKSHSPEAPTHTVHPLQRIREIYWGDPVDAETGPLHLIVEGPANVPHVVALLDEIVQAWVTVEGEQAPTLVVDGPELTQRSYQHMSNIFEDVNMPALSRSTLADALAHDPATSCAAPWLYHPPLQEHS